MPEVTIRATDKDGDTIEITIKKDDKATDKGKEGERGSIKKKKWKKGKDPDKDKPDEEDKEPIPLYDIKVKKDFTEIKCKASVTGSDPDVTFIFDCSDPPKGPSVRIIVKGTTGGMGDSDNKYILTPENKKKIMDFLKDAKFPQYAMVNGPKDDSNRKLAIAIGASIAAAIVIGIIVYFATKPLE